MKLNLFEKLLGSGFFTGYIPFASGTFASFAALLIYYIPGFENLHIIIPVTVFSLLIGFYIGSKFEILYGKDPSQCTIDEMVGMWISLIYLPKTFAISLITFFLWRALDIYKPFPARSSERFEGGFGIMIDDVISGFYTLIIMHLVVYFFGEF